MCKYVLILLIITAVFDFSLARDDMICLQPIDTLNDCGIIKIKFAYDIERGKCATFIWRGCYESDNRFDTRKQCRDTCED